jgi:two-component sensor histidine kinase
MFLKELTNRVERTLDVVGMLASQTLGGGGATPDALQALLSGLDALRKANGLLVESDCRGVSVDAIARKLLSTHGAEFLDAAQIAGPPVLAPPRVAMPLALASQAHAQTAARHSTQGRKNARVNVSWQTRTMENGAQLLEFKWTERDGGVTPDYADANPALSIVEFDRRAGGGRKQRPNRL